MFSLIPKEMVFFDLFDEAAKNAHQGALALVDLLEDFRNVPEKVKKIKDIEHEVRTCVVEAIRNFDPNNGARLGALAKTIITRRLPRQVYQRPPRGDALSRVSVNAGEFDAATVVVSATQPRPLTPVQWAKLIEISSKLRLTRKARPVR